MKASLLAPCVSLLVVACAPASEPDLGVAGTRTVTVTAVDTHVTRRGEFESSPDFSSMEAAIHIPDGAGGFETRTLRWEDGVEIHDVPEGTYYFQLGTRYFVTSAPSLDLGAVNLGRPDAIDSEVSPTDLVFDLDGLREWQEAYDELQVMAPDVGEAYFLADRALRSPPTEGSTELDDARLDWSGRNLIRGSSAGDRLSIGQLVSTFASSGWSYRRLERYSESEPFEQIDGSETRLTGSLAEVPLDSSVQLDWRKTQFAAFGADIHPRAEPDFDFLGVAVLPDAAEHGFYADAPDLFYLAHSAGAEDLVDTYRFGNPYPASWEKFVSLYSLFTVEYAAGSASPGRLTGYLGSDALLSDVAGRAIRPSISPVTNIRINGRPANVDLTGVSATPLFTWDAPSLGRASGYIVSALRLSDLGGETSFELAASFFTDATELRIPPGALDPFGAYVFVVRATQLPGRSLTEAPLRRAFPSALADALTDQVRP